jgi:hypothetical protein
MRFRFLLAGSNDRGADEVPRCLHTARNLSGIGSVDDTKSLEIRTTAAGGCP